MKKINLILKNANLDILKHIPNEIEKVFDIYKDITAPAIIFEDDAYNVYFIARTLEEYLENVDRLPPTLEDKKEALYTKIENLAQKTLYLTGKKYELTDKLGITTELREQWNAWNIDNTIATPTIDEWANAKGKTREEQLTAVGYVVVFTKKVALIQELSISKTQKATTDAELVAIGDALGIIKGCDTVICILSNADAVLEGLRNA